MRICWIPREKRDLHAAYLYDKEWHVIFAWCPRIIKVGDRKCFVWLGWVECRTIEPYYRIWRDYPTYRMYEYRLDESVW